MGIWLQRAWLGAAAVLTLGIMGFYAGRLSLPLPLFATDEAAYLIRALYSPQVVALNPYVAPVSNGVHLSVIRAVYEMGAPLVVGDRLADLAAYLGGLLALWWASAARVPRREQMALLLLALAFPYYRFAASNLAEGLFVGVLALLCVATGRWYRSRPIFHALLAGALGAILLLVKPNGVASLAALGLVAVMDAAATGQWRRLPLRGLLFAAAFYPLGNLIQICADEPAQHPLAFFVSPMYGAIVAVQPQQGALAIGLVALIAMTGAAAVLAGAPIVIGLSDLFARWRQGRRTFTAEGTDLVFLFLVLSLAGTIAMVTLFSMKVSSTEGETGRLWGRYFEFFAPMIWLAAAPALARPVGRRTAWASAGVMLAGLAALLAALGTGLVLFPWDSSALTAFFHADPVRAPLPLSAPYQGMAITATGLAAAALVLRVAPAQAGLGLTLALGLLSTHLESVWLKPMIGWRQDLDRDARAIRPALPATGEVVLLSPEANNGHLGFLTLDARPRVHLGPPSQTPPGYLAGVSAVVVSGPETPPAGPWRRTYQGSQLSLYRLADAP